MAYKTPAEREAEASGHANTHRFTALLALGLLMAAVPTGIIELGAPDPEFGKLLLSFSGTSLGIGLLVWSVCEAHYYEDTQKGLHKMMP